LVLLSGDSITPVAISEMIFHKKIWIAVITIVFSIAAFISCIDNESNTADVRGPEYAGSQTCMNCHKDVYQHYMLNAHKNTSTFASGKSIFGSFSAPHNVFAYNDSDKVVMHASADSFYETEYKNGVQKRSEHFDIVIGSGRKAQTYLYYKDDQVFELPVSYFISIGAWANSPGFPLTHPYFDRPIPSICFGCHSSAANVSIPQTGSLDVTEKYLPGQQILGIDCERCHGPAKAHADYQTKHPEDKTAKFIAVINKLTRAQQMDMCSICHSGVQQPIEPIFSFKPGSKIGDYYYPDALHTDADELDVHGRQAQKIMASECYRQSTNLTCLSCHDPHKNENDNMVAFSNRCMNCHSEINHNFCSDKSVPDSILKTNCIDCHMPAQPSKAVQMLSDVNGKQVLQADYIRTHLVTIYPEETKKVLAIYKKQH